MDEILSHTDEPELYDQVGQARCGVLSSITALTTMLRTASTSIDAYAAPLFALLPRLTTIANTAVVLDDIPGDITAQLRLTITCLGGRCTELGARAWTADGTPPSTRGELEAAVTEAAGMVADTLPSAARADGELHRLGQRMLYRLRQAGRSLVGLPDVTIDLPIKSLDELPETIYTLLQSTIWAIMLSVGIDPQLKRERDTSALWFLCRKFFFVHSVSSKDGICLSTPDTPSTATETYLYGGRVFVRRRMYDQSIVVRVRIPRVRLLASNEERCVTEFDSMVYFAATVKGSFVWGDLTAVGFDRGTDPAILYDVVDGTGHDASIVEMVGDIQRIQFNSHPASAAYERSLGPWHKYRAVEAVEVWNDRLFIQTPVAVLAQGSNKYGCLGVGSDARHVNTLMPLLFPGLSTPDLGRITRTERLSYYADGDNVYVCGCNSDGQLALGPGVTNARTFTRIPNPVSASVFKPKFSVLLTGGRPMVYGKPGCSMLRDAPLSSATTPAELLGPGGRPMLELIVVPTQDIDFRECLAVFAKVLGAAGPEWFALGDNRVGQLGTVDTNWEVPQWTRVCKGGDIVTTGTQTFFLRPDGAVSACGFNGDGGLGIGGDDRVVFTPRRTLLDVSTVTGVPSWHCSQSKSGSR
ncbi:hypothetical protein J8273_1751 [Carpediemonas membranifera]|uniref:Uncharacterized protein n=1 Tax=Carpediemonas membranifera TaxID=201153 RepID=A0A8J6AXR0_9EUKA|nr:hypothetical protein J8273_1751 [Carpediemonas membranifera]|eukprot:KAG9396733.1 hypothetical protein J8273_1751 [Carpediemonas membranifera]